MNKLLRAYKFFLLIPIVLYTCKPEKKWDCVNGTGKIIDKTINVSAYDSIYIEAFMSVHLIQDTTNYVVMNAGENLLPRIDVKVEDNSLYITDRNYCNWVRSYKKSKISADIHFTSLKKLICRSASDIYTDDTLHLETLIIDIWSKLATIDATLDTKWFALKLNAASGLYHIKGKTDFNYIYSIGNGHIYTDEFIAKDGHIYAASTGKTTCNISGNLVIEMYSSGNVYYVPPEPDIVLDKKSYASGNVLPLEN